MNKVTVFQIGNRLSKTMERSAAFSEAWRIVKNGGLEIKVVGTSYGSRQEALHRLAAKYKPEQIHTFIAPEPKNKFDHNALAVMVLVNGSKNTYRLGYIPAKETAKAAAVRGNASLRVVCVSWGICGHTFGARLTLAV